MYFSKTLDYISITNYGLLIGKTINDNDTSTRWPVKMAAQSQNHYTITHTMLVQYRGILCTRGIKTYGISHQFEFYLQMCEYFVKPF